MAVNFLLVGRNGNGKSSIGNSILQAKFFKSNSYSQSSIDNIIDAKREIDGKMITVVDGPFIKDTNLDDPDDIKLSLECGEKAMQLCPDGFDAVLIILKYGERFTKQEKNIISLIRGIFGDNVIKDHGICAFSHGDSFDNNMQEDGVSFESWCINQTGDVAELFKECGNRFVLFNNRNDGSKRIERDTLLSYVDTLRGKRYTYNEYKQAETGRKRLELQSRCSILEEETTKVLDDISVALAQIDIPGNPDYSKIEVMAMKQKLGQHKAYLEKEAAGTQLLDNIFNRIKVTEMSLDTKLGLAEVHSQTLHEHQQRLSQQREENDRYLLDSRNDRNENCCWKAVVSAIEWLLSLRCWRCLRCRCYY